jgi:hypothetical protein
MIGRSGCDDAALDTAIVIGVPSALRPHALADIRQTKKRAYPEEHACPKCLKPTNS